jgi:hypothetical protein
MNDTPEIEWIEASLQNPEFTTNENIRGGEKTTDMVDVKFSDGTTGEGVFRDNPWRSSWMTRKEGEAFLSNKIWSDVRVTHWRPKKL